MTDNIIKSLHIQFINWGDEYVVYHHLSGDTHLLDEVSGGLIELLVQRHMTRDDLLLKLSEWFEMLIAVELNDYLDDFITRFSSLGLIELTKKIS